MVDLIVVCGSVSSSNSKRLRETGEKAGKPTYLIDDAGDLDMALLEDRDKIGISSGASVPHYLVDELVSRIQGRFPGTKVRNLEEPGKKPVFPVPEI